MKGFNIDFVIFEVIRFIRKQNITKDGEKMKTKLAEPAINAESLATLALYAALEIMKERVGKKKPTTFEIDEDTQWVLDCLDEMIIDIKQMHKDQTEQGKRLAQIEARIDNVNSRVDNIVGGK